MLYFDIALQTIRKVKDRVITFWNSLFPWSWLVVDHCENNPHNRLSLSRYMRCPAYKRTQTTKCCPSPELAVNHFGVYAAP